MNYTTKPMVVRYVETDQMKFVHHSNYLKYFEIARLEWLDNLGISYASMEQDGILMPVISVKIKFIKPLFFGDEFKINVRLIRPPMATLEFDYSIVNQSNQEVCKGNTVLAFLSAKKNHPIRTPKIFLKMFT